MKNDTDIPNKARSFMSVWLLLTTVFLFVQIWLDWRDVQPLAYSEFKTLVHAGKLNELTISDGAISGTFRSEGLQQILSNQKVEQSPCSTEKGCPFSTVRVSGPDLVKELEVAGVRFVGQPKSTWIATILSWTVPILLFFGCGVW